MPGDDAEREVARRALLGDLDSIRQLLGLRQARQASALTPEPAPPIPLLRDIVESALESRGYSLEELLPEPSEFPQDAIPVLTECADGRQLGPSASDLRERLEQAAVALVEQTLQDLLPTLEERLRDELEQLCRQHIETLLGPPPD